MKPLVSIVIPCFNGARYLGDAIRSALAQTYSPLEIIVLDDGSTDNSEEVVRAFGAKVLYEKQSHRGVSAARNRGLALAKGEAVAYLDADDCFYPEKVEKQVELFKENPKLGVVYSGWKLVRDGDFVVMFTKIPDTNHRLVDELATHTLFASSSPMITRRAMQKVGGFDESMTHCEDREYWFRAATQGVAFGCVPEILTWARHRDDSASSDWEQMYQGSLQLLQKHMGVFEGEKDYLKKRSVIHLRGFLQYLKHHELTDAVKCLRKAFEDDAGVLDNPSAVESAVFEIAGDSFRRGIKPKDAKAALQRLLELADLLSPNEQSLRQHFYGHVVLGRIAATAGHRSLCREAYWKAAWAAAQAGMVPSHTREFVNGMLFGLPPEGLDTKALLERKETEVCLPPALKVEAAKAELELAPVTAEDYNSLAKFLASYPGEERGQAFWLNRFHLWWDRNPAFSKSQPRGWVLRRGSDWVGFLGSIPYAFQWSGKLMTVIASTTWRVLPDHRNQSLLLLFKQLETAEDSILFGTTPRPEVVGMYRALGFRLIPRPAMPEGVVLIKAGTFLRCAWGKTLVAENLRRPLPLLLKALRWLDFNFAGDLLLQLIQLKRFSSRQKSPYSIRRLDQADASFDELWDQTRRKYQATFVRSSEVLNWYCFQGEEFKKTLFGCYQGDRLVAAMVVRVTRRGDWKVCECHDFWGECENPDVLRAFRAALEPFARTLSCDVVLFPYFSEGMGKAWKAVGLLEIEAPPAGEYMKTDLKGADAILNGKGYFTRFQGDNAL